MEIRSAREGDIPAVAALEAACFTAGADEALLRRMLADESHVILCAGEDGTLAGYAYYQFVADEGYVGNLAVAEEASLVDGTETIYFGFLRYCI